MFCDACGARLAENQARCHACGKPIAGWRPPRSRLARHVHLLGILWLVRSALCLLPSAGVFALGPFWFGHHRLPFPGGFPHVFMYLATGFLVCSVLGFIAGIGLLHRASWARILAIILGVLALLDFPLGTALGVYTLWVLLSQDSEAEYQRLAHTA